MGFRLAAPHDRDWATKITTVIYSAFSPELYASVPRAMPSAPSRVSAQPRRLSSSASSATPPGPRTNDSGVLVRSQQPQGPTAKPVLDNGSPRWGTTASNGRCIWHRRRPTHRPRSSRRVLASDGRKGSPPRAAPVCGHHTAGQPGPPRVKDRDAVPAQRYRWERDRCSES